MSRPDASYRKVWLAANHFPAPCEDCGELVTKWRGRVADCAVIHHVDGDHSNESLSNLQLMHKSCHVRHHFLGVAKSLLMRERLRQSSIGVPIPKMRERSPCPDCGRALTPVWQTRHKNAGRCV